MKLDQLGGFVSIKEEATILGSLMLSLLMLHVYSSSHEDYDDDDTATKRRRHPTDDVRDLMIKVSEFNDNLKPKN